MINIKFFELVDTNAIIKINIFGLTNYQLVKEINRINDIIKLHEKNSSKIKRINIVFSKQIDTFTTNKILTKINDVLYSYYPITKEIKLYNVNNTKQVIPISLESSGALAAAGASLTCGAAATGAEEITGEETTGAD